MNGLKRLAWAICALPLLAGCMNEAKVQKMIIDEVDPVGNKVVVLAQENAAQHQDLTHIMAQAEKRVADAEAAVKQADAKAAAAVQGAAAAESKATQADAKAVAAEQKVAEQAKQIQELQAQIKAVAGQLSDLSDQIKKVAALAEQTKAVADKLSQDLMTQKEAWKALKKALDELIREEPPQEAPTK